MDLEIEKQNASNRLKSIEEIERLKRKLESIKHIYVEGKGDLFYQFGGSSYYSFVVNGFDIDDDNLFQKQQDELIQNYIKAIENKINSFK